MNTLHLTAAPSDIRKAGALLRAGELVAIPTETVYGLAANALDDNAVKRIFDAKGRPQDNPLIVHIASFDALPALCREIPDSAHRLCRAFWPGPLTVILPRSDKLPAAVSAGLDTVAVRMPSHETARAVIRAAGVPLAAPSANLSGSPSPTTAKRVAADMDGRIAAILDGGECEVGVESTVVSLCGEVPRLLRPGGVTLPMLQQVLGEVEVDDAITHPVQEGTAVASPGMKYKHYAPKAAVTLLRGDKDAFARYVNARAQDGVMALCFDGEQTALCVPSLTYGARDDEAAQAHLLFERLREADDRGARVLYAACPRADGVGLAVYNRLLRAAAFRVVELSPGRIWGLTGPTGAGKGTVSALLARHGFAVVDTDALSHEVTEKGSPCLAQLVEAFSPAILHADGTLDRAQLAARAFADAHAHALLGEIVHPFVIARSRAIIADSDAQHIVVDAPLLFESGMDALCDRTIAVLAPQKVRLARVLARDGISEQRALQRMNAQPTDAFYRARADVILENTGDTASLARQVTCLLQKEGIDCLP